MKKITPTLLGFAIVLLVSQCSPSPEKIYDASDTRGKIISTLINNEAYRNEIMDSIRAKYPDIIVSNISAIAKSNIQMSESMMNSMMDMCKTDSSMCKMMMSKTMDMCDADMSKCKMMMGSMQSHSTVMKSMEGMCDMNNMKGHVDNKTKAHNHH